MLTKATELETPCGNLQVDVEAQKQLMDTVCKIDRSMNT